MQDVALYLAILQMRVAGVILWFVGVFRLSFSYKLGGSS